MVRGPGFVESVDGDPEDGDDATHRPPQLERTYKPRRKMVGWYDPRILAMTAVQTLISQIFGQWADKRELEGGLSRKHEVLHKDDPDVWVDYVADLGDGYDPTVAVAWHVARPELDERLVDELGGDGPLRRGDYLVWGGDAVYPTPNAERYLNQALGPYWEALASKKDGDGPRLFALPGNHDWYDGLGEFLKTFSQGNPIGGYLTAQRRSYFALELPHGWWVWGVDNGLGGQIDRSQREYFENIELEQGDKVILCWAKPVWACHDPIRDDALLAYAELRSFEHDLVEAHGASVPLHLSGDLHHFAAYADVDGRDPDAPLPGNAPDHATVHWLTAGGGGAFLHPTHHLDRSPVTRDDADAPVLSKWKHAPHLIARWPNRPTSRRIAARLLAFPVFNPSFVAFMAVVHMLFAWAVQFGARPPGKSFVQAMTDATAREVWSGFLRNPVALLLGVALIASFTAFSRRKGLGRAVGVVHGFLHLVIGLVVVVFAAGVAVGGGSAPFAASYLAVVGVAGGLLSAELLGLYLLLSNLALGMHDNEAFSALHHPGYKHFIRMHITETELRLWVIGLRKVGKGWYAPFDASGDALPCDAPPKEQAKVIYRLSIPSPRRDAPEAAAAAERPARASSSRSRAR